MRVLWIGKEPVGGSAGDEIFDAKTISACEKLGHSIDVVHPRRVGTPAELANLARGIPHPRTRYASDRNLRLLRDAVIGYDIVVSSWEPFDWLALQLATPVILILHNVPGRALPNLFPGSPAVAALAGWARRFERRNYGRSGSVKAIGVLSKRDQAYIEGLHDRPNVIYLPPGMPPTEPLDSDATLLPELMISGTFDWRPKKRDIIRFARDYSACESRLLVRANQLPQEADRLLNPLPIPTNAQLSSALRLGIITDRFESGHKLKTLAYIAKNEIVISFADVSFDFDHIPDHDLFIRRVKSFAHMESDIQTLRSMPPKELLGRFIKFKQRCADCFSWDAVAQRLSASMQSIVREVA